MGDLRDHELDRRYDLCCLSYCDVEIEDVKANAQAGIEAHKERKCKDSEENCQDLRKKTSKASFDYTQCRCVLFRLKKPGSQPPATKPKWEAIKKDEEIKIDPKNELDTPKPDEDKSYYYACFCVAER